jgi:O-acetyl-ADP-ribose deacetylase
MKITIVEGDLIEQQVDCIVNAWNRNLFPWWLLLPQGVSAAIKRKAGLEPFRELRRHGLLPVGGAVLTGPGRLPMKGIIHVAGINLAWRSSEQAIRTSVRSAIDLARAEQYRSIAFPLIGAGTGGFAPSASEAIMLAALGDLAFDGEVRIVRYQSGARA